jgi:type III pantothenate kinase
MSANGEYHGAAHRAGHSHRRQRPVHLHRQAAAIDLRRPTTPSGQHVDALRSGILFGYVGLTEVMIARFRAELGADMRDIARRPVRGHRRRDRQIQTDPCLTPRAVRMIWEMNEGAARSSNTQDRSWRHRGFAA